MGRVCGRDAPRTIEVDVVRVDQVVPAGAPIALLKVDIEGADAWAIMGCEKLLRAKAVQEIWFEQNKLRAKQLGIPLNAAQDFLGSVGYLLRPHGALTDETIDWSAVPKEFGENQHPL